eukprot:Skav201486  [mRNA]  locus=scaffold828:248829:255515:- [translate_table: standard]
MDHRDVHQGIPRGMAMHGLTLSVGSWRTVQAGLFVGWSFKTVAALTVRALKDLDVPTMLGPDAVECCGRIWVRFIHRGAIRGVLHGLLNLLRPEMWVLRGMGFDWIVGAAAVVGPGDAQHRVAMSAEIRTSRSDDSVGDESKQMRATIIAAVSNLSTAYNLVNVNITNEIMENQFCGGDHCSASVATASTACLAGAIFGQLTFGHWAHWNVR